TVGLSATRLHGRQGGGTFGPPQCALSTEPTGDRVSRRRSSFLALDGAQHPLAEPNAVGRPVDEEHDPDQLVAGDGAPGARVARLRAVVAHHEVLVRWHGP